MVQFDRLTPLEHMCLAHEGMHTALLSWFLGEDSPLTFDQRTRLLEGIIGRKLQGCRAIRTRTEVMDIDLLVEVDVVDETLAVAFEVKVRSLQSELQLIKYDQYLSRYATCEKFLLTLIGEHPQSGQGWKVLRWSTVWTSLLSAVAFARSHFDYIHDYTAVSARFTHAVDLIRSEPEIYFAPLLNGNPATELPPSFDAWVKYLRMEQTLRLAWMQEVGDQTLARLSNSDRIHWRVHVNEPRERAPLMDVYRIIGEGPQALRIGLQIQNFRVKIFCHPSPYPKNSTEEQNRQVEAALLDFRRRIGLPPGTKLSSPRNRGFRSFNVCQDEGGSLSTARWGDILADLLRVLHDQLA